EDTVTTLNIDMIGRVDERHTNNENYIYLIGADRMSTELHFIAQKANTEFTNLELDYKFNAENDNNRYYYRSDHYNFAVKGIPVIFFFNGEHEDYTKPTDTADKINYPLLTKRTKLIFATAWYLANSPERIYPEII
ncbi:MAG: M28 family peptidase, partial [Winogradskyella sp.]